MCYAHSAIASYQGCSDPHEDSRHDRRLIFSLEHDPSRRRVVAAVQVSGDLQTVFEDETNRHNDLPLQVVARDIAKRDRSDHKEPINSEGEESAEEVHPIPLRQTIRLESYD